MSNEDKAEHKNYVKSIIERDIRLTSFYEFKRKGVQALKDSYPTEVIDVLRQREVINGNRRIGKFKNFEDFKSRQEILTGPIHEDTLDYVYLLCNWNRAAMYTNELKLSNRKHQLYQVTNGMLVNFSKKQSRVIMLADIETCGSQKVDREGRDYFRSQIITGAVLFIKLYENEEYKIIKECVGDFRVHNIRNIERVRHHMLIKMKNLFAHELSFWEEEGRVELMDWVKDVALGIEDYEPEAILAKGVDDIKLAFGKILASVKNGCNMFTRWFNKSEKKRLSAAVPWRVMEALHFSEKFGNEHTHEAINEILETWKRMYSNLTKEGVPKELVPFAVHTKGVPGSPCNCVTCSLSRNHVWDLEDNLSIYGADPYIPGQPYRWPEGIDDDRELLDRETEVQYMRDWGLDIASEDPEDISHVLSKGFHRGQVRGHPKTVVQPKRKM